MEADGVRYPPGFPMPRDPLALTDRSRRPIVRRQYKPRFPFPVPNGWFVVAESSGLAPGEHRNLYVFGTDLVLFRGDDGAPALVDAYCAHFGAHLGVGGTVEGDCIRCPFHGWRYDASGACAEIPYGNTTHIPSQARVRSYPCVERNHMIWAWHHLAEADPFYEVPVIPELHDPEWCPYEYLEFDVATCAQEMMENNVDYAHFKFVHGTEEIPEDEFFVDGHYKRTVGATLHRESFGLGLGVVRVPGAITFLSSTTPVDTEHVTVRWIFTAPRSLGPQAAVYAREQFAGGVSQDLPIWENKRFVARPVLTKGERVLLEQRAWAEQFYTWSTDQDG